MQESMRKRAFLLMKRNKNKRPVGKWIYLSYPLSPDTPAYGGEDFLKFRHGKSMTKGDSCNTSYWILPSHLGTHIDFPRHFVSNGMTANEYPCEFWIFQTPCILHVFPVEPGTLIGPQNLELAGVDKDADLLLLKTNFGKRRNERVYWEENPGIEPDMASFLRENLPNLRVLGFDFISLSSFAHRELGRNAHRAFLDHPNAILPLEDVNLSRLDTRIRLETVIVSPLIIESADAVPCTVFAQISDE